MCAIEYYTYDDYKLWEGDWELIRGYPIAMAPSPFRKHQLIIFEIAKELANSIEGCNECEVGGELDYIVSDDTVLRPDVYFTCEENGDYLTKPPKIIVEVISKNTQRRDENIKKEIYLQEGVKYYVLVYPDRKIAKIYKLENAKYILDKVVENEIYKFDVECNPQIDFKKVFKKIK